MQTGGQTEKPEKKWLSWLYIAIIIAAAAAVVGVVYVVAQQTINSSLAPLEKDSTYTPPEKSTETPAFTAEVVVSGRQHIWDVDFLPDAVLFAERKGVVSILKDGKESQLAKIDDVYAVGEGGLMGMVVDPDFATNRYLYTCFNSNKNGLDVRVVRWKIKTDLTGLEDRADIITGLPSANGGRHSGCRPLFGPDGHLWVGTGDSANDEVPQSPTSLGGKIVRVDRDGKGVEGNLAAPFDPRIYSYGHRNVQGLAFFTGPLAATFGSAVGISAEHGPNKDDEINLLTTGNFGWAPGKNYNELVPMTDKQKFPDAKEAIWSSGFPTQAPSGVAIIHGNQWKGWEGAAAVAMLKGTHLKILRFNSDVKVVQEEKVLDGQFGRLRAAKQRGSGGALFITTDNGTDDKIIRIYPD